MSTTKFKIASKFKTEAEKKAEQDALIAAAWDEVPPSQGPLPRAKIMKQTPELLEACKKAKALANIDFYNRILERTLYGKT